MLTIDLNSDLGESFDGLLDTKIMPYISSCSIACGGHFGDETTMERTILEAKEHGISIGAHPSYPDKENFGRLEMAIADSDLKESIYEQLVVFLELCDKQGVHCAHVKPHGALYNAVARNETIANLICEAVASTEGDLNLFGLAHSQAETIAEEFGIPFVAESFADRRYEADGTLMSRVKPEALLDEVAVLSQVRHLVFEKRVESAKGWLSVESQTICLHSDTEGAVNLAQKIHQTIVQKGVDISAVQ